MADKAADKAQIKKLSTKIEGAEGVTLEELMKRADVRDHIAGKIGEATTEVNQKLEAATTQYAKELAVYARKDKVKGLNALVDQFVKDNNIAVSVKGDVDLSKRRLETLYNLVNPDDFDKELNPVDANGNHAYHPTTHQKLTFADYLALRNPFPAEKFPGAAGGGTPPPADGGQARKYRFATAGDYMKARKDASPEERAQMAKDWQAQQAAAQNQ